MFIVSYLIASLFLKFYIYIYTDNTLSITIVQGNTELKKKNENLESTTMKS